jgi:adenine-specific DNA glycosylase
LVKRAQDARLMGGMWEMPQLTEVPADTAPTVRLRHSITDTDYQVSVFRVAELSVAESGWFSHQQWKRMALTGLARKILAKAAQQRA